MQATVVEVEQVLELLAETPRRLMMLTDGVDIWRLHARPEDNGWTANEVLAHLRACADVWGKSILAMLAKDHPHLRYVSPRTWIRKTDYVDQEYRRSLGDFMRQRDELMRSLRALTLDDWSRTATFAASGKERRQIVFAYAPARAP
jgi:hypothetical protein